MIGVGLLDWLFGAFVAFGMEGGTIGHLQIPWSHSLLMATVWSAVFACLFWRRGQAVMVVMFAAVMSHWVLDLLSHSPDMSLWPHAAARIGLGPYLGGLGGWCEGLVTVACTVWYARASTRTDSYGGRWQLVCGVMALLYLIERVALS
jgi:hypothetical protein